MYKGNHQEIRSFKEPDHCPSDFLTEDPTVAYEAMREAFFLNHLFYSPKSGCTSLRGSREKRHGANSLHRGNLES